jgi:hypothetical protein
VTAGPGKRKYCEFPIVQRPGKPLCKQTAGAGTEHKGYGYCRWHGGTSPSQVKGSARAVAQSMARELNVTPTEASLVAVRLAAGAVEAVREQVLRAETLIAETGAYVKDEEAGWGPTPGTLALERWWSVYGEAIDRLAKTGKMAVDAGVSERLVALEEERVMLVAEVIRRIFADPDLGLTAQQKQVAPRVSRTHLLALEAGNG